MSETQPQTITPERQIAAAQVGAVFNSIHQYLATLQHVDAEGNRVMTKQLEQAHIRVDEASFWAIRHALTFGIPSPPKPAANDDAAKPAAEAAAPAAETPAPIGEVDAAPVLDLRTDGQPLPETHASGTEAV